MKYRINLLPSHEQTVLDRAIYFSFHYLRYILVLTQFVVICVFMYRFNIDQEIVDTKDTLNQKYEIITVSRPLLAEGQRLYQRSENITALLASQNSTSSMVNYVLGVFPQQLRLNTLSVKSQSLTLAGLAPDAKIIQSFYTKLKKDGRFKMIDLQSIAKTETGYSFSLILNQFI